MITLIAAIGQRGEIGNNNALLCKISEDMQHFKAYTSGKVVVMGRKTFDSIGHALPGRKCIVVSTKPDNRAIYASSINDALSIEHCYPEIVVIGGATIYDQTISLAHKLVITHIHSEFVADTYFPIIDSSKWFKSSSRLSSNIEFNYEFAEYLRR